MVFTRYKTIINCNTADKPQLISITTGYKIFQQNKLINFLFNLILFDKNIMHKNVFDEKE